MIGLGSDEDPYYGGILWHLMIKLPFPSLLVATLWVTFLADLELCITHNESQIEGSFFMFGQCAQIHPVHRFYYSLSCYQLVLVFDSIVLGQ